MAFITGKTMQGCCMPVHFVNGIYECEPDVGEFHRRHRIYNDYHVFYAKITGEKDEKVTIRLNWPEFNPDAVSDEYKAWADYSTSWDPLMKVLEDVLYFSTDEISWENIKDIKRESNSLLFTITLTEGIGYLCTPMRYSCTAFEKLKSDLADNPFITRITLGKGWDGGELDTFIATDPTVDNNTKKTIYMHAVQHCHEQTGAHVLDALLRFLAAGDEEARELLRRYIIRLTPVVDVTGWRNGYEITPQRTGSVDGNPNRDWGIHNIPETRLLADYLKKLAGEGENFVFFGDLHGGGGSTDKTISGPNGIFLSQAEMPITVEERRRFILMVTKETDYMKPDQGILPEWTTHEHPHKFSTFVETNFGAPAFTFELAHASMWDRKEGRRVPNTTAHYRSFAKQLIRVIDRFTSEKV